MIDFLALVWVHVPLLSSASRSRHRIVHGFSGTYSELGSPAFSLLDHRVTKQCSCSWLLPLRFGRLASASPLRHFFFLRASSQEWFRGSPAPVNVISSELVLDTLSHSWILVGLDVRHLPVQEYGGNKACLTTKLHQRIQFFMPFRLRT
jgi:hypothetical protein